jgi:DNA mismatch repair ATPase MutL
LDTTPVTTDNDQVRYQYWQSEADKRENELSKVRATNELLTQQLTSFVSNTQQPQQQQQPEEQVEEFPPPPNKPDKPRTYNREEAYTDSSSESARYLDDIESWRDDMDEYNSLQAEYQSAKMSADREEYQRARQRDDALRQQASENDQRMGQLKTHLRQKYNASDTEFDEFVQIMSNPESLTPDNLWRLYQMDRGVQTNVPSAPAAPSAAFEQTRRAQSVPSPMGVLPSQNVQVSDRSVEDKLMDSIIEDQNRLNII